MRSLAAKCRRYSECSTWPWPRFDWLRNRPNSTSTLPTIPIIAIIQTLASFGDGQYNTNKIRAIAGCDRRRDLLYTYKIIYKISARIHKSFCRGLYVPLLTSSEAPDCRADVRCCWFRRRAVRRPSRALPLCTDGTTKSSWWRVECGWRCFVVRIMFAILYCRTYHRVVSVGCKSPISHIVWSSQGSQWGKQSKIHINLGYRSNSGCEAHVMIMMWG